MFDWGWMLPKTQVHQLGAPVQGVWGRAARFLKAMSESTAVKVRSRTQNRGNCVIAKNAKVAQISPLPI